MPLAGASGNLKTGPGIGAPHPGISPAYLCHSEFIPAEMNAQCLHVYVFVVNVFALGYVFEHFSDILGHPWDIFSKQWI